MKAVAQALESALYQVRNRLGFTRKERDDTVERLKELNELIENDEAEEIELQDALADLMHAKDHGLSQMERDAAFEAREPPTEVELGVSR